MTSSRGPPGLRPRKTECPPPVITRVFASPQTSLSSKLSAVSMLPRPSPLRREVSFEDGSSLSDESSSRKRGRSDVSSAGLQPATTSVSGPLPSSGSLDDDGSNKRPRLNKDTMAGENVDGELGETRLRSVSSPAVVSFSGDSQSNARWWSWSSVTPSTPRQSSELLLTDPATPVTGIEVTRREGSNRVEQATPPNPLSSAASSTEDTTPISVHESPSHAVAHLPGAQEPARSNKPARKKSWFGSLRKQRPLDSATLQQSQAPTPPMPVPNPPPAQTESVPVPEQPTRSPSPIPVPTRGAPLTPTPSASPSRSWYPSQRAHPAPRTPKPSSGTSTPHMPLESPDVNVPLPSFMHSQSSSASQSLSSSPVDRTLVLNPAAPAQLSALNASTLRYTLSLPLLGRPKTRLPDGFVKPAKLSSSHPEPDIQHVGPTPEVSIQPPTPAGSPDRCKSDEQADPVGHASDVSTAGEVLSRETTDTYSWWSYFGFASAPSATVTSTDQSTGTTAPVHATSSMSSADVYTSAPSSVPGFNKESVRPPAASVLSAETSQTHGSLWYQPWYWYTASPDPQSMTSASSNEDGESKTEAERVKEDALAREQDPVSEPEPAPRPPTPPLNPLLTQANRSLWVTFFSSRNPATPAIGDGSRSEMEVMDIDDDPPAGGRAGIMDNGKAAVTQMGNTVTSQTTQGKPSKTEGKKRPADPIIEKGPSEQITEPPKESPIPPITSSKVKGAVQSSNKRSSSAGSKKDVPPSIPNFLLPTFPDVFYHPPLSIKAKAPQSTLERTMKLVNKLLSTPASASIDPEVAEYQRKWKGKDKEVDKAALPMEGLPASMPRSWSVLGQEKLGDMRTVRKAVVIGIHGWFPGIIMRSVLGEPTGTSTKFAQMMRDALTQYLDRHNVQLESLTQIPLEGEGTIQGRVDKLCNALLSNSAWCDALHEADVIFVAAHSQGSVVACHVLDRLIEEGHIRTEKNRPTGGDVLVAMETQGRSDARKPQKVVCLSLCGIHLGPLLYLNTSILTSPFIQYVESEAARELFEFQDTNSEVSKRYVNSLRRVLDNGCKFVYVASLNDQVVPIYSGAFISASHPLLLRALYVDGDAYSSTDFLTNLIVFCLRLRNAGLSDGGLIVHLSEATAGSLSGVGHSSAYEEMTCYSLAVRYLFETDSGSGPPSALELEAFSARESRNDYEIPWILNELVTHPMVQEWFSSEINELRAAFDEWKPKTAALKDIRRKLEPIKRVRSRLGPTIGPRL